MSGELTPEHWELITAVNSAYQVGEKPERDLERTAVKSILVALSEVAPGRSVELRIPPYAAIQVVAGHTHRRGTPSAVVETDPRTLVALALGELTWNQAVSSGSLVASGERSDLSALFPLV